MELSHHVSDSPDESSHVDSFYICMFISLCGLLYFLDFRLQMFRLIYGELIVDICYWICQVSLFLFHNIIGIFWDFHTSLNSGLSKKNNGSLINIRIVELVWIFSEIMQSLHLNCSLQTLLSIILLSCGVTVLLAASYLSTPLRFSALSCESTYRLTCST